MLTSCDRMKRPWAGQKEEVSEEERPEFDPGNPLCPGVQRPSGKVKLDLAFKKGQAQESVLDFVLAKAKIRKKNVHTFVTGILC